MISSNREWSEKSTDSVLGDAPKIPAPKLRPEFFAGKGFLRISPQPKVFTSNAEQYE